MPRRKDWAQNLSNLLVKVVYIEIMAIVLLFNLTAQNAVHPEDCGLSCLSSALRKYRAGRCIGLKSGHIPRVTLKHNDTPRQQSTSPPRIIRSAPIFVFTTLQNCTLVSTSPLQHRTRSLSAYCSLRFKGSCHVLKDSKEYP
jgi:hypothetical protein